MSFVLMQVLTVFKMDMKKYYKILLLPVLKSPTFANRTPPFLSEYSNGRIDPKTKKVL